MRHRDITTRRRSAGPAAYQSLLVSQSVDDLLALLGPGSTKSYSSQELVNVRDTLSTNFVSDAAAEELRLPDHLAAFARQWLIAEAELTPKPGLVDRRGPGTHEGFSLELIRLSATVLETYFAMMIFSSTDRNLGPALREELAVIGRAAERAMYNSTNRSDAYKGAIWICSLLVAAAARTERHNAEEIVAVAGSIARLPDRAPGVFTHGEIAKIHYGVVAARAEVLNDFPHVIQYGLPTSQKVS